RAQAGGNGVFASGGVHFPTQTYQAGNYWVDVVFDPAATGDTPPVFTSSATFSLPENTTLVGTVKATDAENNPLTYAIAGGPDAALFTINATTDQLTLVSAPA